MSILYCITLYTRFYFFGEEEMECMYLYVYELCKLYTHVRVENKGVQCCVGISQLLTLCRRVVGT